LSKEVFVSHRELFVIDVRRS